VQRREEGGDLDVNDKITVKDWSDDENLTLNLLLGQLEAKAERNLLRAAYYDMRHAVQLTGSVIPPQYWRLGIVLGWSGKAVDTLARRCNLDGFVWPDGDLNSLGFSEVWEGNNLASEVDQAAISSLIHATAFAVNTFGDESLDEPVGLIHFKDALNATGSWNPRRRRLDNLLSVTTRDDKGKPASVALYLDGVTLQAGERPRRVERDIPSGARLGRPRRTAGLQAQGG
jgi:hypothetical protein